MSCPFSTYNISVEKCEFNSRYSSLLAEIISTPNSGLIMRISPFIIILDEFSYYAYHAAKYDRGFQILVEISWNITNTKWVPRFLDSALNRINSFLQSISINDTKQVTPARLQVNG